MSEKTEGTTGTQAVERPADEVGELYLGDAIHFFLSAKRAGGRSERTIDEYRKKLDLFQRWMASRSAKFGGDENTSYIETETGLDDGTAGNPVGNPNGTPVDAPYIQRASQALIPSLIATVRKPSNHVLQLDLRKSLGDGLV